MALDLTDLPYIDGHMHPPLRRPPATPQEYRWPWYEGSADLLSDVTGPDLVAQSLDGRGGWADPGHPCVKHSLGK